MEGPILKLLSSFMTEVVSGHSKVNNIDITLVHLMTYLLLSSAIWAVLSNMEGHVTHIRDNKF